MKERDYVWREMTFQEMMRRKKEWNDVVCKFESGGLV